MKLIFLGGAFLIALSATPSFAQKPTQPAEPKKTERKHPAPPVTKGSSFPKIDSSGDVFVYDQKPISGRSALVTPEQAEAVIARFRQAYPESPRLLLYVNRVLIDQDTGMKLSARSEETESVKGDFDSDFENGQNRTTNSVNLSGSVVLGDLNTADSRWSPGKGKGTGRYDKVTGRNVYKIQNRKELSLADRQTVRDVERLFGRPLRMAGAALADQRVAAQLLADKPLEAFVVPTEGEQARKDREAIRGIADVVIEVLISSRDVVAQEISGPKTYTVPDIQATAIRLDDSRIVGQASSSDILGPDRQAGRAARNHDVREITEATALALMEDMLLNQSGQAEEEEE